MVQEELGEGQERHHQLWHARPHTARPDARVLRNLRSGLRMDIMVNRRRSGSPVPQCQAESRDDLLVTQLWQLTETGKGQFQVAKVNSDLLPSVREDSTAPGTALEQASSRTDQQGRSAWIADGAFSDAFKGALDGGGVFEAAAKGIADPRQPYVRFEGYRGGEFIQCVLPSSDGGATEAVLARRRTQWAPTRTRWRPPGRRRC
ncbi:RICIN domain-containing protein [Streptomyces sp. XD-27]|uniref:RICIN domain-containing protein n=1 Tax=Streptomyces sp. XD-27 TaxID=3062779 RepID=UPI0026F40BAB|nr:RICIN domain-containing protein [Streptomyces sp. XD-27]WKX69374.1 RICIN domain-containing protein [Streptomyces sp. XD-27]